MSPPDNEEGAPAGGASSNQHQDADHVADDDTAAPAVPTGLSGWADFAIASGRQHLWPDAVLGWLVIIPDLLVQEISLEGVEPPATDWVHRSTVDPARFALIYRLTDPGVPG